MKIIKKLWELCKTLCNLIHCNARVPGPGPGRKTVIYDKPFTGEPCPECGSLKQIHKKRRYLRRWKRLKKNKSYQ